MPEDSDEMESSSRSEEGPEDSPMSPSTPEMEGKETEDNDEEPATKQHFIQLLEESVKNIMSIASKHCESISSDLRNSETLKKFIVDFDKSWITRSNRKARRHAEQYNKRAEKLVTGKPRSKRGPDVAEVFSPPRMTKMVHKLDIEA